MIELVGITKKFKNNFWEKEFFALENVSFTINEGDLVGFLGANGAGKTTLIKCLMDFSRLSLGEIKFDKNLGSSPLEIKSKIGYLPERAYLYQHLTGREFLTYTGRLNSISSFELNSRINEWAQKIQIDHALDRHIRTYSKGMQQRLGFISCLIHRPTFLVLDEPLSGLDPLGRKEFKLVLKELNREGVTIFFSSHIVADVEQICNSVVFIEKGKLIYNGNINELLEKNSLEAYSVSYYDDGGELQTVHCPASQKDALIRHVLQNGGNLVELEKEKLSLEEIIYKIKQ